MSRSASRVKVNRPDPYYNYDTVLEGYIRLLKIHRASDFAAFEEPLSISLFTVPLHSSPDYAALSYTWGQPNPLAASDSLILTQVQRWYPIRCNGKIILITRNLRDALRHLRDYLTLRDQRRDLTHEPPSSSVHNALDEVDYLWIDAICIDQDDLWERSAQVGLMGSIYRQALGVTIWLGNQDEYTKPAVQFMWDLASTPPDALSKISAGAGHFPDDGLFALTTLLARNWFSRMWTLQEAILAPRVFAYCGGISFSFDLLLRSAVILGNTGDTTSFGLRIQKISTNDPSAELIRRKAQKNPFKPIIALALCRNLIASGSIPDIMKVIFMNRVNQATDERDRIYGVLGITSEFQLGGKLTITPDYTKSTRDVYVEATEAALRSRNDLALLAVCTDHKRTTIQDLPSWCPDYGASYSVTKEFADRTRKWHLELPWAFTPRIEVHQNSILSVQGFRYDKIAEIGNLDPKPSRNRPNVGISAPFRFATRVNHSGTKDLLSRPGKSRVEMLWRTLMLDEFEEESPAPPRAGYFFRIFVCTLLCMILSREDIPVLNGSHDERMAQDNPIMVALRELEADVGELIRLEPDSAQFLPDIDRIRHHISHPANVREGHYDLDRGITNYFTEAMLSMARSSGSKSESDKTADSWNLMMAYIPLVDRAYVLLDRSLLRTAKGSLGICSLIAEPEDEIWLLHGAYAPVLLRSLGNGRYRFLGEVFVYGIMNGEVILDCGNPEPVLIE